MNGQLGDGSMGDYPEPVQVAGGLNLTAISAGPQVTCGVTTAQEAYCWVRAASR